MGARLSGPSMFRSLSSFSDFLFWFVLLASSMGFSSILFSPSRVGEPVSLTIYSIEAMVMADAKIIPMFLPESALSLDAALLSNALVLVNVSCSEEALPVADISSNTLFVL